MAIKFDASGIPYIVPLTDEQKKQLEPSGIMPSGESNFYDYAQIFNIQEPSGINIEESGIFHFNGLNSLFSNVSQVSGLKASDFEVFNSYIHYYPDEENLVVKIPYTSSYKISTIFDPYTPRKL